MASEITQRVLREVIDRCLPGASIKETCIFGDKRLDEETLRVFKKDKDVKKGIAFPTCLSINNYICHFSPLISDPDMILKDDDVVKIDLGCHVDGYVAVVAHTLVVGATREKKVTGRRADCILAAYHAAEAALRLVKPKESNTAVTEMIDRIAQAYHCKPVEGKARHGYGSMDVRGSSLRRHDFPSDDPRHYRRREEDLPESKRNATSGQRKRRIRSL